MEETNHIDYLSRKMNSNPDGISSGQATAEELQL